MDHFVTTGKNQAIIIYKAAVKIKYIKLLLLSICKLQNLYTQLNIFIVIFMLSECNLFRIKFFKCESFVQFCCGK